MSVTIPEDVFILDKSEVVSDDTPIIWEVTTDTPSTKVDKPETSILSPFTNPWYPEVCTLIIFWFSHVRTEFSNSS